MKEMVEQSFKGIDFDEMEPIRWWINGEDQKIILDPKRSFGRPIEVESGIPTLALHNMVVSTGDIKKTAKYFETDYSCVERAHRFESDLTEKHAYIH